MLKLTSGWIDEGEGTDALKFGVNPPAGTTPKKALSWKKAFLARPFDALRLLRETC